METKKELLKRIKELESLIQQKEDLIIILKQQLNPISDANRTNPFALPSFCEHNGFWKEHINISAPYRECTKCGHTESIDPFNPHFFSF